MSFEKLAAKYFLQYLADELGLDDYKSASEEAADEIIKLAAVGLIVSKRFPELVKIAKKLTYQERESLPDSAFAIVYKDPKTGEKIRKYPIHDLPHARNALARVAAFGSPEEKKKVYAAIRRRWPDLWARHTERNK